MGSSSTINALILFLVISIASVFNRQERDHEADLHPALAAIMRFEPTSGAVKPLDSRASVGQSDPVAILNSPARGQRRPVVVHVDLQAPVVADGAKADNALGVAR